MSALTISSAPSRQTRSTVPEQCYASGIHRLIGDPTSEYRQMEGRIRTSNGSSSDGDSVQDDGFVDEAFRAGGPYVCAIPATTTNVPPTHPCFDKLSGIQQEDCRNVIQILKGHKILARSMGFFLRTAKHEPETPILTLFIEAEKRNFDDSWLQAVRGIHKHLGSSGLGECSVEMADPRAFEPDLYFPLKPGDPLYADWYEVLDSMFRTCVLVDVNTIGCFRIGRNPVPEANPITILITVDKGSFRDWRGLREDVIIVLETFFLPMVGVKIQQDQVVRTVTTRNGELPSAIFEGPALAGQSLGWRDIEIGTGTLGGFVELKDAVTGSWRKFALTCSHCIIPDLEQLSPEMAEEVRPWTMSGFGPEDLQARKLFCSDQPSLGDIISKENGYKEEIEETKSDPKFIALAEADKSHGCLTRVDRGYLNSSNEYIERFQAKLNDVQNFRKAERHHLGQAFAASGERSKVSVTIPNGECTVDWGLVEVDDHRMGENVVATLGNRDVRPFEGDKKYQHHHEGPIGTGFRLFKCGRTTGYTKGVYNDLKTVYLTHAVINGELVPQPTLEHTVTNQGDPFALRGDSGALVIDSQATVVGLHWAGLDSGSVAYFTHIEDIFHDIKMVTGAEELRMMEDS